MKLGSKRNKVITGNIDCSYIFLQFASAIHKSILEIQIQNSTKVNNSRKTRGSGGKNRIIKQVVKNQKIFEKSHASLT